MVNSDLNNNEYEWEDQLADYALGVMSAGEAAEFERKLNECRANVSLADQYAHAIGLVGLAAAALEPPSGHKERLLARLDATAQETPPAPSTATSRTGPLPIVGAGATPPHGLPSVASTTTVLPSETGPATGSNVVDLGEYRARRGMSTVIPLIASVAAALIIALGLWGWFSTRNEIADMKADLERNNTELVQAKTQVTDLMTQLAKTQATLNIPPDYVPYLMAGQEAQPQASGIVFINRKTNDVELVARNLNSLPDTKVYEMWWLPKGSGDPVKAGIFKPDESGIARHTATPPEPLSTYKTIAVSEEQAPGVDKVQGPIVLVGKEFTP